MARQDWQFDFDCGKCHLEMVLWADDEWLILHHLMGKCREQGN